MKPAPLLQEYRVGIVVPKAGINGNQLMVIGKKLDEIAKLLPDDGKLEVVVPGFDLNNAEASVVRDLRNLLERKSKVRIIYLPVAGDHKAGVAEHIVYSLGGLQRRDYLPHRCDEVWCCPAEGQTARSNARVAQVWRLAQAGAFHTRPAAYKLIPPWVEAPKAPDTTSPKKGKKSWRDMFNKWSFR